VKKADIAKAMVALVALAAIFATGLYFGRTGAQGAFTVTTQYGVGPVEAQELEELAERVEAREERRAADESENPPVQAETIPAELGDGLVNINTASSQELQILSGVGPAIAERIIAHRETYGPFRIIEEITDVSGIGQARFADIRDHITV